MRRARRTAACAAVVMVVLSLTALSRPAAGVTSRVTSSPCGGEKVKKSTGAYWTCSYDDEFTATALNSKYWTAINTSNTGAQGGQECNTPQNVRVTGGLLVITATKSATKVPCGHYPTYYSSGMLITESKFAQAYGRFEMRAKFPAGKGFQPAFWLLPENPRSSGKYEYGEIDVVEAYSHIPSAVAPHLHFVVTPGTPGHGVRCSIPTSQTAYHTYAVEWTPTQMRFIYDGTTCWSTTWRPKVPYAPIGARVPAPFDQPFYIIVQLAVGGRKTPTNKPDSSTHFPAAMDVDYIRVWK